MPATLYPDLPIEKYHEKDGYISKSSLADILDCPAVYKYWHVDCNPREEKDHFNVGNCVHTLALEPELFSQRFYFLPEGVRRDIRTAKYQGILATAGLRKIITASDFEDIKGMAESLRSNKKALALLQSKGKVEPSIYWEEDNFKFKARPDFLRDDGLIVDLKTTKSAYKPFFQKDAFNFHYDLSVALTSRGYQALTGKEPENYVFLAVESKPPYLVECYDSYRNFDSFTSFLKVGQDRLEKAINKLHECLSTGHWASYHDDIQPLGVPSYAA